MRVSPHFTSCSHIGKYEEEAHAVLSEGCSECSSDSDGTGVDTWKRWKRLCKAERAAMTLDHLKECMMVAEYYNGY